MQLIMAHHRPAFLAWDSKSSSDLVPFLALNDDSRAYYETGHEHGAKYTVRSLAMVRATLMSSNALLWLATPRRPNLKHKHHDFFVCHLFICHHHSRRRIGTKVPRHCTNMKKYFLLCQIIAVVKILFPVLVVNLLPPSVVRPLALRPSFSPSSLYCVELCSDY